MKQDGLLSAVGSHRSWREMGWLLLGLPLGLTWGVYAIAAYATAGALIIVWVGLPLVAAVLWTMRAVGAAERATINAVLGERIVPPGPVPTVDSGQPVSLLRWTMGYLADPHAWRVTAWTLVRLVTGPVGFVLAIVALISPVVAVGVVVVAIMVVSLPVEISLAGYGRFVGTDYWWLIPASIAIALIVVPLMWWILRGFTSAHRVFARWALGPCVRVQLAAATQRAELAEERVRIDQELHDSIGHMITMNIVQAGAGSHVFDSDPEFARQALRTIEERGRAAMGELDRIIAALRGDDSLPRAPLPGLEQLADLVAQSKEAGMDLHYTLEPPAVSGAVGRGAYSIAREALTNAARHAQGARVSIGVTQDGDALAIEVISGKSVGRGAAPMVREGGGSGVAGMRDRAALLGGRAEAVQVGDDFVVRALLPVGAMLAPPDAARPSPFDHLRGTVTP